jgi:hypothetical protein
MDGSKNCPHREVDVVCALDVHGHTHSRGVRDERMRRMAGGHDKARANRLLPKVILKNLLLDALHNVAPKETNHPQVHTCIHQSKGVPSSDDAIE